MTPPTEAPVLIDQLLSVALQLGWRVAVLPGWPGGMILGTDEYMKQLQTELVDKELQVFQQIAGVC